jgi:hypothetical protein
MRTVKSKTKNDSRKLQPNLFFKLKQRTLDSLMFDIQAEEGGMMGMAQPPGDQKLGGLLRKVIAFLTGITGSEGEDGAHMLADNPGR